jgi:hypothetical protein
MANDKDLRAINARIQDARPAIINEILNNEARNVLHRALTPEEIEKFTDEINKLIDAGNMHISSMSLTVLLSNGASYEGEIKAYSDPIDEGGKDIAIIKIDGRNLPTVPLGNSDDVNVGEPLTVIGYPGEFTNAALEGLFSKKSVLVPTVTTGHISAVNKVDYRGTPVLQSEATINHGNSGGPAFDANGKAIAIATYSLNKAEESVAGLNFFVPINTAMEFVRAAGAPPERGAFDEIWHKALDAYQSQHWYQAHELMGGVLELAPDQPDALKLQMQAAENLRSEGFVQYWIDRLGVTGLAIAGGALVVAILLVALLTRKPQAPAAPPIAAAPVAPAPAPVFAPPVAPTVVTARPGLAEPESYGVLYINNGALSGNRFPIPKKGLLIGRDPSVCSVVLPDDTVSKEHAWVVPLDNGVAVIDRSSANGTYVNSTDSPRISKMLLKNNDRIFIGSRNPTAITYFSA